MTDAQLTDAQLRVRCKQIIADVDYERRKFRKKCVTLGIVEFTRKYDRIYYEVYYRGRFICTLYNDKEDDLKLLAVWNTITIAEETIKKIEGVKHEGN